MKTNHTKLASAVVVVLAGLSLAACSTGGDPQTGGNSGGDSTEPVTITYTNFISSGANEANLDTIVKAFEDENPGIKVEVTTMPYADYFTALQTDIVAGTVADVFDIEYANYGAYQASGVLAAIDGVDTSVYQSSLAEAYATDGTQYALPSSFSNVVLFYNKDLFDAAGVAYPSDDWTWADEKAAAEALTNQEAGVWGDYQPISYNEYYKAVAQAGGEFLSADGKTAAFNSDPGLAAAAWLTEKSGTVMPTAEMGAGTADFDTNLFADGKLAMWHTGIWMFGSLAEADFAWDIAVEPGDTQKASAMFSNAIAISATSKHQEAAAKWAAYMTSSDTMVDVRLAAGWELPPIADQSKLDAYLTAGAPANRQAVFDSLKAVALAPSIGDNQTQMQDDVTNALTEIAAGRQTIAEAIPATATAVDALLG
ncbi:MAG: sugar ABC transporter substrate-binding protein [Propionibacteriaceae bacterium]|jgi:multiple sugar transport system substrate-binding protein|nr:sugar ABC transporter substrate-binding protein [Propionibacteriaceae bacterium]